MIVARAQLDQPPHRGLSSRIAWLVVLGACELRPAPKREPVTAVAIDAPAIDAPLALGAGASSSCLDIARHLADVMLASTKDTADRAILEQERDNTVTRSTEACTTQQWSAALRDCYLATQTPADVNACAQRFVKPI